MKKKFSLIALVRGLDIFGHPITVNFRGSQTHKSILGALCTLTVYAITIAIATTKLTEIKDMNDPQITAFTKPLTEAERSDIMEA